MAYVYPSDAPVGVAMCNSNKHHWHMTASPEEVRCCRCDATEPLSEKTVSEGPHDDRGDAKE